MIRPARLTLCAMILAAGIHQRLHAEPVTYTNAAEFIEAVVAQGYVWVLEGFEDSDVWGNARSTISGGSFTVPVITNFGVRFSSNTNSSGITSSQGAALNGQWGGYSLPHGSYATGEGCDIPEKCGDGILISSDQSMYAISAWVRGTFGGKLAVILDGDTANPVGFDEVCDAAGENCVDYGLLTSGYKFFGVIAPLGFHQCELREMEGTAEDQKFIWTDDVRIALSNAPPAFIRSLTKGGDDVHLHIKELAVPAPYTLERSSTLSSNDWSAVNNFTASSSETNHTSTGNQRHHAYFRLRSP